MSRHRRAVALIVLLPVLTPGCGTIPPTATVLPTAPATPLPPHAGAHGLAGRHRQGKGFPSRFS